MQSSQVSCTRFDCIKKKAMKSEYKCKQNIEKFTHKRIYTNVICCNVFHRDKRRKVFVNSTCDQIKIVPLRDSDSHYLILKLDEHLNVTILSHSLPENEKYFKSIGTIEMHSATFFSLYEQMDDFYAQMNTIDELTYVVDPEEVTTKHNYRVIKLGNIIEFTRMHC